MEPTRVTAEESERLGNRSRHHIVQSPDWSACADGAWWLVHEGGGEPSADYERAFERIKRGSKLWAVRTSMAREIRRAKADRKVWVRFTKETT